MYLRGDRLISFFELSISLLVAMAIGWMAANSGSINSSYNRSIIFGIVVMWATLEFVPIALHMARFGFDGLSLSMAAARLSIMNYFGAMSLNMGGLVGIPLWYFNGSRMALALACGGAAFFLFREVWWAFDDLTKLGKVAMSITVAMLAIALFILIVTF